MPANTQSRRMRATLVRFGPQLYEELQEEAAVAGVSVSQYVREAVVARIAYTAGQRGDKRYQLPVSGSAASAAAGSARTDSARIREEAAALRAENQQARRHRRETREKRVTPS